MNELNIKSYSVLSNNYCLGNDPKICCQTKNISFAQLTTERVFTASKSIPKVRDLLSKIQLLDHETCGQVAPEARVLGGSETSIFEFPWMALIAYGTKCPDSQSMFLCGATVINKNYLLTAAHCVTDLPECNA